MKKLLILWAFSSLSFLKIQAQTIINQYAAVTSVCKNSVIELKDNADSFSENEEVIIIQMQGAKVELDTNTGRFGEIIDIGSCGLYEINKIAAIQGNKIHLLYKLKNTYNLAGKVQVVSMPNLGNGIFGPYTCAPWDGEKGGMLAFSGGFLQLGGNLDVTGKGFRGGQVWADTIPGSLCGCRIPLPTNQWYYAADKYAEAGEKGEGIAIMPMEFKRGPGAFATAGGGGVNHNYGAGGGSSKYGAGGAGADFQPCLGDRLAKGGFEYIPTNEFRIFMGGGGGAGHANNSYGTSGGNGGGIILIKATEIDCQGYAIYADGENAQSLPDPNNNDGGGAGGAGGTILLSLQSNVVSPLRVFARGGKGSTVRGGNDSHGSGGGGGGGLVLINKFDIFNDPINGISVSGGLSGTTAASQSQGATDGKSGKAFAPYNLVVSDEFCPPMRLASIQVIPSCDSTTMAIAEAVTCLDSLDLRFSVDAGVFQVSDTLRNITSGKHLISADDGCWLVSDTIVVVNYPPVKILDIAIVPFRCDSLGTIQVNYSVGQAPVFLRLQDRDWQNSGYFPNVYPNNYLITVKDSRGCADSLEIDFQNESVQIAVTILLTDSCVFRGVEIPLSAEVSTPYPATFTYDWSPETVLNDGKIANPICKFNEPIRLTLTVRDEFGCEGKAEVETCVKENILYIPNAINPFSSIGNEYFTIMSGTEISEIVKLNVFDRWGNEIFKQQHFQAGDLQTGWNGTFRGKTVDVGVYAYRFEVLFNDGVRRFFSGSVSVIY